MTIDVEDLLAAAMREEVAGLQVPAGIVARAALNRRRGRRLRPVWAIAAAAGMAAALVIGVTVTLTGVLPGGSGHGRGVAAGVAVPSPAAGSISPSFRVKVLNTSRYQGQSSVQTLANFTGVYDPATRTGQGRTRYIFDYAIAGDDSVAAHRMTGTIRVHHASHLIAGITEQTTVVGPYPKIADGDPLTFSTTLTFSDYGLRVKAQMPPSGPVSCMRIC